MLSNNDGGLTGGMLITICVIQAMHGGQHIPLVDDGSTAHVAISLDIKYIRKAIVSCTFYRDNTFWENET